MIGFQSDLHKNRIWADSLNEANVSYDVMEKCKKNKNSNIEDKPLSCYV